MKVDYTKGPWFFRHVEDQNMISIHLRDGDDEVEDTTICGIWGIGHEAFQKDKERVANASLIAAAPELLEALEKCIAYIPAFIQICGQPFENEHGREVYDKAKAAINKAKGL